MRNLPDHELDWRSIEVIRLQKQVHLLRSQSPFDNESGLLNRSGFLNRGAAEVQRAMRYDYPLALVVFAMAQPKPHQQDNQIQATTLAMAQICDSATRSGSDIVGRLNEILFAVLLPHTERDGAVRYLDRVISKMESIPVQVDNCFQNIVADGGCSTLDDGGKSIADLVERAIGNIIL